MANFCGKCGTALDANTGLCPNCDRKQSEGIATENAAVSKPKNKSKTLTTIFTILLSVCLFITSLLSIVIYDVRNAVKEDNLKKMLDDVQAVDVIDDTGMVSDSDLERFYELLDKKYDIEMSDRELDSFIDDSTIKPFIADKIADFCEEFFEGDAELKIRKSEIVRLIEKNRDVIGDEFGVYLWEEDIYDIAEWITPLDEVVLVDSTYLEDNIPAVYYISNIGLSYVTMTVLLVLSALIIFFMIKNSWSQALCGVGIDFVIIGGLFGLVAMFAVWITPLWNLMWGNSLISALVGEFMAINAVAGIVLLVLGIVMLVLRGLIKKYLVKKSMAKC